MPTDFLQHLLEQPLWVQVWVAWLALANLSSGAFLRHREARVVLAVFLANILTMSALFAFNGFNRLLGLSHIVWWTPMLVYLVVRLQKVPPGSRFGRWLRLLVGTNAVSLMLDYADVIRFILGDRS